MWQVHRDAGIRQQSVRREQSVRCALLARARATAEAMTASTGSRIIRQARIVFNVIGASRLDTGHAWAVVCQPRETLIFCTDRFASSGLAIVSFSTPSAKVAFTASSAGMNPSGTWRRKLP